MKGSMSKWIFKQKGAKKEHDMLYSFFYKDVWCAGVVCVAKGQYILSIRPMRTTDDIGTGKGIILTYSIGGCQVTKTFKKK